MTDYNAILQISDGTITFDLLPWLKDWTPSLPGLKGGGTFLSGVFSDGRRPVLSNFDNAVETFYLVPNGTNQDGVIAKLQTLRRLLQKGLEYWTTSWQNEPVYIVARGSRETNTRYAVLTNWSIPTDDNPYAQPFYARRAAMVDISLIVEHDHWQSEIPGNATCVQVNNLETHPTGITTATFVPTAGTDDGYVNYSWRATVSTAGGNISMGYNVNPYGGAVRFRSVTIPHGATIHSAFIRFVSIGNYSTSARLRIYIQESTSPSALSDYADFITRTFLANPTVQWIPTSWTTGNSYDTPDITELLQWLVDQSSWASGHNLLIHIKDDPSDPSDHPGYRDGASWDNVTYTEPQLVVKYSTDTEDYGRAATCDNEVFIASRHTHNQIDTVMSYDDSTTTWSTRTIGAALPYDITDVVPEDDDIIYFGISTEQDSSGPFCGLVFDLSSAMTGVTDAEWQYWDGAAWQTIDTVCDNTSGPTGGFIPLQLTGVHSVHWEQPDDWEATTINGVEAWYVRIYVTTGGAGGKKVSQQNREVYAITIPYIDIPAASITGDLSASIRIKAHIQSANDLSINDLYSTNLLAGLRSYDRGANFTAYINMSNAHNAPGVQIVETGAAITVDSQSPSGYSLQYTPSGVESDTSLGYVAFSQDIGEEYVGTYRAFLRVRQTGGSAGDISIRLRTFTGLYVYSEFMPTNETGHFDLLDMGIVAVPEGTAYLRFYFGMNNTNAANPAITIYDFILMPIDEWTGEFYETAYTIWNAHYFDIDSATHSKQSIYTVIKNNSDDSYYVPLTSRASSRVFAQSSAHQRLWFMSGYKFGGGYRPYPEASLSVEIEAVTRYFSMRGSG